MVENRAERIDIAALAHRAAFGRRLLRRHVVRRTEHLAAERQFRLGFEPLGQAEVRHARLIGRGVNQHVRRLEIAMQHIPLVRKVDRFGDGLEIRGRLPGRQRTFGDELREGQSLDVIHREEVLPLGEADFVNGDDVRMLQAGGGGGFGAEALNEILCPPTARPTASSPRRCGPGSPAALDRRCPSRRARFLRAVRNRRSDSLFLDRSSGSSRFEAGKCVSSAGSPRGSSIGSRPGLSRQLPHTPSKA